MKTPLLALALALAPLTARAVEPPLAPHGHPAPVRAASGVPAAERPVEIHDQLTPASVPGPRVALTLDACMGGFDDKLIAFLIRNKIPATIFATRRWLAANPRGTAIIKSHLDMFEVEDHGANHVPAVIGPGKKVYGIAGEPDVAHLRREVSEGARAIVERIGVAPHWYRAATAEYDREAIDEINKMGYRIAGFSVNADVGATLDSAAIEKRLKRVRDGDVIIAHMNKPASDTAKGLAAGIQYLRGKGFVFVRVDQADLRQIPPAPRPPKRHS